MEGRVPWFAAAFSGIEFLRYEPQDTAVVLSLSRCVWKAQLVR